MPHYNTTNERGAELARLEEKAETLSDKIHRIFKTANKPMTASDVKIIGFKSNALLTSIRARMSESELLIKTNEKKMGLYGSNEYFYKLK